METRNTERSERFEQPERPERRLRDAPPRDLSPLTQLTVLFGGTFVQMGSVFFGAGMAFLIGFLPQSQIKHLFSFDGEWTQGRGVITTIERTNVEVNNHDVYAYSFDYQNNGTNYSDVSYDYMRSDIAEQQPVVIEYKSGNPARARIAGMDEEMMPAWIILLLLIFPGVGGTFLVIGLRRNIRALRLLINGVFTKGVLLDKQATNTRINNQMVYRYEFEFDVERHGKIIATCSTHHTRLVEDEGEEIILYDAENPDYNVVYDAIPMAPYINRRGEMENAPFYKAGVLVLPVLMLLLILLISFFVF